METNLTERINIRLQPSLKDLIRQAAMFNGQSLSDFMLSCSVEKARNVIKQNTVLQMLKQFPDDTQNQLLERLDLWASGQLPESVSNHIKRDAGQAKGKYALKSNFDEPLEGFEEYMP